MILTANISVLLLPRVLLVFERLEHALVHNEKKLAENDSGGVYWPADRPAVSVDRSVDTKLQQRHDRT